MATSYGTATTYKAWADARGISYAGKTDGQIGEALLRASEYIDAAYLAVWPGVKAEGRTQERQWPRAGVWDASGYPVDADAVPAEVLNAVYEGAQRELVTAGALNKDIKPGGGVVRRVKAGSTEVEFEANGATSSVFSRIDEALAPLIGGRSNYSGRAARA